MKIFTCLAGCLILGSCGISTTPLPEIWDRHDFDSVYNMEVQIKQAIYCELKRASISIKNSLPRIKRIDDRGVDIATDEDQYYPDSWGILVQITIQAQEKSALTPGIIFKSPFQSGESFAFGMAGEISSDNTRSDKFNSYYSAKQLKRDADRPNTGTGPCRANYFANDPKISSSPFLNASQLGIHEWLKSAVRVIQQSRSSREAETGEGAPLGAPGTASDSATYDNKFVIISSGNIAPSWNLVRLGTPSTPLLELARTRTHQLIMTLGPSDRSFKINKKTCRVFSENQGPSQITRDAFNATLIGSAVSNGISNALRPNR